MKRQLKIIKYFQEISKIPRSSCDEKKISGFFVDFAKKKGYKVNQDKFYNVIIKVPGNCKDKKIPSIALQGHLDMVYVKTNDSKHIYEQGIECVIDKDRIFSKEGTSLGADNGVALAYFLEIMDCSDIVHPPLEIILTAQEEIGLIGAQNLDYANINSKMLINLDSEKEGEFCSSCAGGIRNLFTLPISKNKAESKSPIEISITGLKGGHSGIDIDKGRGNAIKILARLLKETDKDKVGLVSFKSEGKANAISTAASAITIVGDEEIDLYLKNLEICGNNIKNELKFTEQFEINVTKGREKSDYICYAEDSKIKLLNIIALMPFGVISRNFAMEGSVESSVNIGALEEDEREVRILSSIRSSLASIKHDTVDKFDTLAKIMICKSESFNDYPQWDYEEKSALREIATKAYEDLFEKQAQVVSVHGGLECGYFSEKIKKIDLISMGCNLYDVHTPREQVSIESIHNNWDLLIEILRRLAKEN